MSNILFPPAGTHPAAYSHPPAIAPRGARTQSVTPVAQSAASGFQFTPERGSDNERRSKAQNTDENRSAPPTVLQIKIDSMLREQAEARQVEMAQQAIETETTGPDAQEDDLAKQGNPEHENVTVSNSERHMPRQGTEDSPTATGQSLASSDKMSRSAVFNTLP